MIKKRIEEVDILRGIAFLAVVLQHSLASFIYEPSVNTYQGIISAFILNSLRFAVPIFVFMTGFSLYYTDKGQGYFEFIRKRFKQIILPYMIWTLIYDILMFFIMGRYDLSLKDLVFQYFNYVLTGTGFYHLWYMAMIIQFYIIYPVFKLIINKNRSFVVNTIMLFVAFIAHYGFLYWYNFYAGAQSATAPGVLKVVLQYSDRLFVVWMFYFIFGAYLAIYYEKVKEFILKFKYIWFVGFAFSIGYIMKLMISSSSYNENGGYVINHNIGAPLSIPMVPLLIFSILGLYVISIKLLNVKASKYILIAGKYSFGAYLCHALVLHYINIIVKYVVPGFFLKITASFVLCAVISIYIVYLLSNSNKGFVLTLVGMKKQIKQ
ncbi:MAG: acyltransferase [Clostridium sp.]|uniref:acyltransferase n=1 Tax=Clostridium sp. TaxID=1506 RepID=UPI002FC60373